MKKEELTEIKSFDATRLTNDTHYIFMKNVSERMAKEPIVQSVGTAQLAVANLATALNNEDRCFMLSQKSALTESIKNADLEADKYYIGYTMMVRGLQRNPDPEKASAANELYDHYRLYDISVGMQMDKEASRMNNLVRDLEGAKSELVAKLSLQPYVAAMKTANNQVIEFINSRTDESSHKAAGALQSARNATDEAYAKAVRLVNALAVVGNPAEYQPLIEFMNETINRYVGIVAGKTKNKEDASQDSASQGDATPDAPATSEPDGPNKLPRP